MRVFVRKNIKLAEKTLPKGEEGWLRAVQITPDGDKYLIDFPEFLGILVEANAIEICPKKS